MELKTTLILDKFEIETAVREFVDRLGYKAELINFSFSEESMTDSLVTGCEVEVTKNNDV